jgi:hypothetical protein
MPTKPTSTVDFRKLLRDVLRGAFVDADYVPTPLGGPLSPDDAGDELADELTAAEWQAYAQLVREIKAEAIAAGETRTSVIKGVDDLIADCDVASRA